MRANQQYSNCQQYSGHIANKKNFQQVRDKSTKHLIPLILLCVGVCLVFCQLSRYHRISFYFCRFLVINVHIHSLLGKIEKFRWKTHLKRTANYFAMLFSLCLKIQVFFNYFIGKIRHSEISFENRTRK